MANFGAKTKYKGGRRGMGASEQGCAALYVWLNKEIRDSVVFVINRSQQILYIKCKATSYQLGVKVDLNMNVNTGLQFPTGSQFPTPICSKKCATNDPASNHYTRVELVQQTQLSLKRATKRLQC